MRAAGKRFSFQPFILVYSSPLEGIATRSLDFTVIIPTHNRSAPLAACLAALARSSYPHELFEVVVVDDGGGVDLSQAIASFESSRLRLLRQSRRGPGSARNTGARAAMGRWLAFTDDDCMPEPGWLNALAKHLTRDPHLAVGGHTINHLVDNPCSSASQLLIDFLYSYYNIACAGNASFFTSNNLAVPAAGFQAMGGFDEIHTRFASEDREFCSHWLQRGHRLHYEPMAQVRHAHHLDVASFWRQHFDYGCGAHYYHLARAARGEARPRFEPLTFYLALVVYPWRRKRQGRLRLMLLLSLSQVAHTAGFITALLSERGGPGDQPVGG
ncbi:MAG: glycosyltransferase [Cyanobacteriota bacterium]|nr:glycosyltransferase [Cyanobacteriota bacterium]